MSMLTMSVPQARQFLLSYHGLTNDPVYSGKDGVLQYIRHVNCIQFDPLNIVGRNAELVLQSRVEGFCVEMLEELLYTDRKLIDGWDKVMSIYPVEDWPYFARHRTQSRELYSNQPEFLQILPELRDTFASGGPLSSKDLTYNDSIDWAWAPTRISRAVLESMYQWGELIVHHKKNNHKVYDLATRHLPSSLLQLSDPNPSEDSYWKWRIMRRTSGVGLIRNKPGDVWVGMNQLKSKERQAYFEELLQNNELTEIQVDGMSEHLYARTIHINSFDHDRLHVSSAPVKAFILAPLDNMLWDRKLIQSLFGFSYTWEVYKPAAKRTYGYYVLPVLYGDHFVARFEPGKNPQTGQFMIKNWWWEDHIAPDKNMINSLMTCFSHFLYYLKTPGDIIEGLLNDIRAKMTI